MVSEGPLQFNVPGWYCGRVDSSTADQIYRNREDGWFIHWFIDVLGLVRQSGQDRNC